MTRAQLNMKLPSQDDRYIKILLKESFKGVTKSGLIIALVRFIYDVEKNARINGDVDDLELINTIKKSATIYDREQRMRSGRPAQNID